MIQTRFRGNRDAARQTRYEPTAPITATNVQDAISQVEAQITLAGGTPPTISATVVTFAMSPYTVLPTDYILEVNTTGGVVVINPQAVATRTTPLEIKDTNGNANTNNIQVTGPIEGQNPYLIDWNFGSLTIRPNKAQTAYEVVTW